MELKEYQAQTLDAFGRWLDALEAAQLESQTAVDALAGAGVDVPDDVRNYPKKAWQALAKSGGVAESAGKYVSRRDDAGRPIPHICFKVPTGGGKTLLAAAALERLSRQSGLTLWIMPTKAIYAQTKAALKNREHPYRQMLERASGGRVKLLEKDDVFTRSDVANYLCVMLLMLPATNRQKGKDFLKMFRDSGRYPTLFPDSDDALSEGRLLSEFPDLERAYSGGPVKHSLFNVFKMLRPAVILDEAHKAYGVKKKGASEEFVRAVNRLDPSLVIELSATPNRGISNLLVDITGVELKNEEMIKLPVEVTSFTNDDWQHTLAQAYDRLEHIDAEAVSLQHSEGRYIRPIAVVRAERTGKDQRDGERIHSEDVREYLTQGLGVPAEAVAVKSAEMDELSGKDLLSPFSQVRWIITKSALMEGWDCPFAYVLVMLDNTQAQNAITQLVGRVMRQPHARRTGREQLDKCYVFCMNTDVSKAVSRVKNGLENEGLTGLGDSVMSYSEDFRRVTARRRKQFRDRDIFLPKVLHADSEEDWVELDYQRHILPEIDWDMIDAPYTQSVIRDKARVQSASVDVGDALPVFHADRELFIDKTVKIEWFARRLSDMMPNPWQAARIAQELIQRQRAAGVNDDYIYDSRSYLAYTLRHHVSVEVEQQAERVFQDKLNRQEIRFDLQADKDNFRMVDKYEIPAPDDGLLDRNDGNVVQLSMFEPMYARYFDSDLERNFARYLDEQKALKWWHRVAMGQRGEYYLRGWKRERIWPDFVAMGGESDGKPHMLVFETKGRHMQGSPDTDYKRRVLKTLERAFNAGHMTLRDGPAKGTFRLVFDEAEFPTAISNLQSVYNA